MAKIAFSTLACPGWSFEQVVTAGARYGYDGVEIRQIAGEVDLLKVPAFDPSRRQASRDFVRRSRPAAGSSGFCVCGLASSVRFDYPEKTERDRQLEVGMAYVELAADLGAGFVRVFGDAIPKASNAAERKAALTQIAEGLNRLGNLATGYGIDILLETHGDFADSRTVKELFGQVDSPRVGVLWDTHHPWRFYQESPASTLANLGPWLKHTHWKDSVTLSHDNPGGLAEATPQEEEARTLMSGHRHADYVLFGGGEFPIAEFVRLLKQANYDGWLSLEWEKMWHPELAGPEVALPLFPGKMRQFWDGGDEAATDAGKDAAGMRKS